MADYLFRTISVDGDEYEVNSLHSEVLGWAVLAQTDDALINSLCSFLVTRGLQSRHWRSLTRMPSDGISCLIDKMEKAPLEDVVLSTLDIVGVWGIGNNHWDLQE